MKTPREILFQRHQAAEPKLDAIRHEVVNTELKSAGQVSCVSLTCLLSQMETGWKPVLRLVWGELVWPCRHIWTGLAAAWMVILAVNFSMRDHSQSVAEKLAPPSAEMILTWRQQERLLAELIGPNEMRTTAPPKPFSPRPSSERRFEVMKT